MMELQIYRASTDWSNIASQDASQPLIFQGLGEYQPNLSGVMLIDPDDAETSGKKKIGE